jgi:hypothetical protein
MPGPTRNPPFPDACRTGRLFITVCCAASTREFLVGGALCLAFHVEGHGWFELRPGCVDDINDDGTLVEADGTERPVRWRADRDGTSTPGKLALDSAADWHQEAENLRAMAGAPHLDPASADLLRREAEAADQQAAWWDAGGGAWSPKPPR